MTKRLNVGFQERLAERTRIAQELHDTLLQGVLSATLQLDVAEDQLPEDSSHKTYLETGSAIDGYSHRRGQKCAPWAARNGIGQPKPGVCFLATCDRNFPSTAKIDYRVIVDSVTRPIRPLIRDEVYRIGREALLNAFKHAHASCIEIEVEYASRQLRVLVRDNGRGIDPQGAVFRS